MGEGDQKNIREIASLANNAHIIAIYPTNCPRNNKESSLLNARLTVIIKDKFNHKTVESIKGIHKFSK